MARHQGRKVFTLQTLPPHADGDDAGQAAKVAGFYLHAGVVAEPLRRDKLARLCRYISRPAVSEKRIVVTPNGKIRYQLKTPYGDGTTHVAALAHPCARGISASLHVIASIEDPAVIAHILKHLKQKEALQAGIQPHELPPERAPPVMRLFD